MMWGALEGRIAQEEVNKTVLRTSLSIHRTGDAVTEVFNTILVGGSGPNEFFARSSLYNRGRRKMAKFDEHS